MSYGMTVTGAWFDNFTVHGAAGTVPVNFSVHVEGNAYALPVPRFASWGCDLWVGPRNPVDAFPDPSALGSILDANHRYLRTPSGPLGSNGSMVYTANGYPFSASTVDTTWTGSFNATAGVPIEVGYAMLLAGLGLMGFVARRRKQKAA